MVIDNESLYEYTYNILLNNKLTKTIEKVKRTAVYVGCNWFN